jgi:uncharacterized cupredoxin-like copper-binding protein
MKAIQSPNSLRQHLATITILTLLVTITACSGGAKNAPATIIPSGSSTVDVTLTEFKIDMPQTLPAGPTTFVVKNAGTAIHNFEIQGQGIDQVFPSNLAAGDTQSMEVDLKAGTYRVWCPVDAHADRGMELQLTVTQ